MRSTGLVFLIAVLVQPSAWGEPRCEMSLAFKQSDDKGRQTTAVWSGAPRAGTAARPLLFGDRLNANTDGTRRSYRVDDFWGERVAINNLCNAMSDACDGLKEPQLRERRLLTEQAKAQGWPKALLAKTRISPDIIPLKDGKPCPEQDGFLVSATAFHKRMTSTSDVCDLSNYVDALVTPAIVLPKRPPSGEPTGFDRGMANVGDLVAVMTPGGAEPVFAVVGDKGPWNELGEGSVALNAALLGITRPPRNYPDVKRHWVVAKAFVLVFPNTRDANDPYITPARIDTAGKAAFDDWGGGHAEALQRLRACMSEYRRN